MSQRQVQTNLNSFLIKNLDKKEIEELGKNKESARKFLKRLKECIEERIEDKVKASENELKYSDANWMLYQADNRGYRRALRDIINIL